MERTEANGECSLVVTAATDGNVKRPSEPEQMLCAAASSDSNVTNSSSTSSGSSYNSSPGYLKGLQAALKRQRPLGAMASTGLRARRVPISQQQQQQKQQHQPSQDHGPVVSRVPLSRLSSRVSAPTDMAATRKRELTSKKESYVSANLPDDSSLTPPSITGTLTASFLPPPKANGKPAVPNAECASSCLASAAAPFSLSEKLPPSFVGSTSTCQDIGPGGITDSRMVRMNEVEVQSSLPINQDLQLGSRNPIVSDSEIMKTSKDKPVHKINEQKYDLRPVESMTQCSTIGSSCATTMSIHSGPTLQSTHAACSMQTEVRTQTSAIGLENPDKIQDRAIHQGNNPAPMNMGQLLLHSKLSSCSEKDVAKGSAVDKSASQPCANSNISTLSRDVNVSHSSKDDKASRKKKYDPDLFFKVNGKYYQKLGKIGSGGSSEVYRVISSDCTIYALKRIKLKGRDYPTAYGFCQEIQYLNKLKGKSNIIELVDYEVTDKSLLEDIANGHQANRDGKIRDDNYIYMVLEYGEIDLAHMLSQKWKEAENSSGNINENWLRFYWQQMLEAVSTIHEERIVHSDLKPANFLLVKGSLKLIDFGIAKAIMSDTTNIQRDAQVGTLNYMSPEAFMWNEQDPNGNTIKCGRPSDIWSLGCILYQMVYGKTPFADYKTFWAKFKVITDRDHKITYDPVSNPWLVDLMKKCLAWDRDERWRIPQLLQHPFLNPPMPPLPSAS